VLGEAKGLQGALPARDAGPGTDARHGQDRRPRAPWLSGDGTPASAGVRRPSRYPSARCSALFRRFFLLVSPVFSSFYGGHQFGHWAGQLGDGRAISLGEPSIPSRPALGAATQGCRSHAVLTRGADGRAVLRSSMREFLCSEAMHHLGVPTTRALSLVGDRRIGDARHVLRRTSGAAEPGAVVCRVAPSFMRFGNFELPAARGDIALLEAVGRFHAATRFSRNIRHRAAEARGLVR
jgi:uncharacterized protein YdiU (UPF0061 family)